MNLLVMIQEQYLVTLMIIFLKISHEIDGKRELCAIKKMNSQALNNAHRHICISILTILKMFGGTELSFRSWCLVFRVNRQNNPFFNVQQHA